MNKVAIKTNKQRQSQQENSLVNRFGKVESGTLSYPGSAFRTPFNISRLPVMGNTAGTVQTKFQINHPNDKYEQEADRMADQIMRMTAGGRGNITTAPNTIQRKCAACEKEEEEKEQRKPSASQVTPLIQTKRNDSVPSITPSFQSQLNATKGWGSPLPKATNQFMSTAFGTDFSHVRIHYGHSANQMNQGIQAKAFTHGSNIYFNKGQYSPHSTEGKRLLAHELTHVVQQKSLDRIYRQENVCGLDNTEFDVCSSVDYSSDLTCEVDESENVCKGDFDRENLEKYVGTYTNEVAYVKARRGIRLHATPSPNDYAYQNKTDLADKVYLQWSYVKILGLDNNNVPINKQWALINTNNGINGFDGWIERRHLTTEFDKKDRRVWKYHVVNSGEFLNQIIRKHYYGSLGLIEYGQDERAIAEAFVILNEDNSEEPIAFLGKYNSSFIKDTLLDASMERAREIYNTAQLIAYRLLKFPSPDYIQDLIAEGRISKRADWKNSVFSIGRSIEGFIEGVAIGFGKAIVDAVKDLWNLIKDIISGELFNQAYELYKQVRDNGLSVIWNLIKDFFIGIKNDFIQAWENPNPYKKWYFFGEIIGMILFEVAIAYLTAGIGTTRHLTKVNKVLGKVPGLKKISVKISKKVDDIPAKELKNISKVSKAEEKIDNLGAINGETRKMLRNPANEKLLDSLNENPFARRVLKKCNSPCYPEFATPSQVKEINNIIRKIDTHLNNADYDKLKDFFHEASTVEELGEKIDVIRSGLNRFIDDKARGISPFEIDRLERTEKIRNTPGFVKGGDNLPVINSHNVADWYDSRIMQIPKQVADNLKLQFKNGVPNFRKMREALWKEMYHDSVIREFLEKRGATRSLAEMKNGRAPYALGDQRIGGGSNAKLQLNHQLALEHAGEAFDLDNLEIVSPVFHEAMKQ